MYKFIITVICCYVQVVYACDFCGCSPSVMNSDLLSLQPQSSIGINSNYKGYKYLSNENGLLKSHMVSNNLMVAYAPKNWVELRVNLPLIWMMNQYSGVKDNTFGIGDMSLLSNFKVVNRSPIGTNRKVGHTLLLGYGLEFPTGKNQVSDDVQLQNFTLGSKSMDFLFSVVYSMSYRKWNVIGAGLVKINTENKDKVRYGHLYSIQLGTAYTHTFKKCQLLPNMGLRAEIQQKNLHNRIIQKFTGSYALFIQYGADLNIKNFNMGVQIQHPLVQNTAFNSIKQQSNFSFKVAYIIKKKVKVAATENELSENKK